MVRTRRETTCGDQRSFPAGFPGGTRDEPPTHPPHLLKRQEERRPDARPGVGQWRASPDCRPIGPGGQEAQCPLAGSKAFPLMGQWAVAHGQPPLTGRSTIRASPVPAPGAKLGQSPLARLPSAAPFCFFFCPPNGLFFSLPSFSSLLLFLLLAVSHHFSHHPFYAAPSAVLGYPFPCDTPTSHLLCLVRFLFFCF